jgi:hypothetical protein
VAYQHHERQDGGGYPRGLIGNNVIGRSLAERMNPKRMLLIAELAAVADVYSALTSDRPYRPAMPLDRVHQIVNEMAGPHLNRDVVRVLTRTIPMYPVGHWVEVLTGTYRGWRGVVSKLAPEAINLPTIRLLLNARGDRVPTPVDVSLRANDDVQIRGLPPGDTPFELGVAV